MSAAIHTPLLRASGINTFYGASHILRDIDLTLSAGEAVSLLGRNGMGKTTLLRSLMGLTPAKTGRIQLDGQDITRARSSAIARAGMALIPEGRGIFPNLSVMENLIFAQRPGVYRRCDWSLEAIYEMFPRLYERRDNWGNQLSGGEQQMLTIGRALLSNPRLILIDEATEGLAPKIRALIWQTLQRIKASGVSLLIVDKNLEDLHDLCDRHMVLAKGEIVFCGTGTALKADPALIHRWLGV